eukprot:Colp12_sorted_trinity150504_noHs@32136
MQPIPRVPADHPPLGSMSSVYMWSDSDGTGRPNRLSSEVEQKDGEKDEEPKYIQLKNNNLKYLEKDVLYHFGFDNGGGFPNLFSDVKFVCMGGSPDRMLKYAKILLEELNIKLPVGTALTNLSKTDRYAFYKVGPVLSVSHGMGLPSLAIMLHEITKLLYYAKATDVTYIRIGSSGGLGVNPGSLVITTEAVNAQFQPIHEVDVLGKRIERPSKLPLDLANEIYKLGEDLGYVVMGKTMCCNDFYEAQARLDGAICEYTPADKMEFLKRAHEAGVRNIEMETTGFAGFCSMLNIPAAVLCATYLNRLHGDQIASTPEVLADYSDRPQRLVIKFIKHRLGML